jgi:hypothetical protein
MAKLLVLASGVVEPAAGQSGELSAFVAYNPRPGVSRLFKVSGPVDGPHVTELPPATTVDLGAFRLELEEELRPAVARILDGGGSGSITTPEVAWVTAFVERFLEAEGA